MEEPHAGNDVERPFLVVRPIRNDELDILVGHAQLRLDGDGDLDNLVPDIEAERELRPPPVRFEAGIAGIAADIQEPLALEIDALEVRPLIFGASLEPLMVLDAYPRGVPHDRLEHIKRGPGADCLETLCPGSDAKCRHILCYADEKPMRPVLDPPAFQAIVKRLEAARVKVPEKLPDSPRPFRPFCLTLDVGHHVLVAMKDGHGNPGHYGFRLVFPQLPSVPFSH